MAVAGSVVCPSSVSVDISHLRTRAVVKIRHGFVKRAPSHEYLTHLDRQTCNGYCRLLRLRVPPQKAKTEQIMTAIAIEDAHTKCPYCGIICPLVPPPGERRHAKVDIRARGSDTPFWGCITPLTNPRQPKGDAGNPENDDGGGGGLFTCFTCNVTEGYGRTGKKIKRRFTNEQRRKGALARCKLCVSKGELRQYPAHLEECRDTSPGKALYDAVDSLDVETVSSLLRDGADPNYAVQATIDDESAGRYNVGLWNLDGSIVHDIYHDGERATRPLPLVAFMLSDALHGGIPYEEYNRKLDVIARMLIDAGATGTSLNAAAELLSWRYGYEYGSFDPSAYSDWPAVTTIWRAQHSIRSLLAQCQEQSRKGGVFDFGEYFRSRPPPRGRPNSRNNNGSRKMKRKKKKKERMSTIDNGGDTGTTKAATSKMFALTEKAVRGSDVLLPYYLDYALRRATLRFESHRVSLFGGRSGRGSGRGRIGNGDGGDDGKGRLLPALPRDVEARIRALALVSADDPVVVATKIPRPLSRLRKK